MKYSIIALLSAVFITSSILGDTVTNSAPRRSMKEITGGSIMRPVPDGSRAVIFLDAVGSQASTAAFDKYQKRFNVLANLYVKRATGDWSKYDNKAGDVIIAIVEPSSDYAIYPRKQIALVPFIEDEKAMGQELWKATVALFSMLSPTPNDFHAMGLISGVADALKIPRVQRVFYKKALEEGWAPPPKDKFQQAVWDRFHSEKKSKQ